MTCRNISSFPFYFYLRDHKHHFLASPSTVFFSNTKRNNTKKDKSQMRQTYIDTNTELCLPVAQRAMKVCACFLTVCTCARSSGRRLVICTRKSWGVTADRSHLSTCRICDSMSCTVTTTTTTSRDVLQEYSAKCLSKGPLLPAFNLKTSMDFLSYLLLSGYCYLLLNTRLKTQPAITDEGRGRRCRVFICQTTDRVNGS